MTMRLTKRLFVLFLAFWLPLSVLAANSMAMEMGTPASYAATEHGEGCLQHEGGDAAPVYGECYGCSFCHFACTALIASSSQAVPLAAGWVTAEFLPCRVSPFVLDRLQRPPSSR